MGVRKLNHFSGKTLIAFMNSFSQGMSGGDVCFIEICKRLKDFNKIIVTSALGEQLCRSKGLEAEFVITTREQEFKGVIWTYIKRILKALFIKINIPKSSVVYSTSDFFPDVLPSFFLKARFKKHVSWIQKVFHLIPESRRISHWAQKMSFAFIKRFADLVIVDNQLLKRELIKLGFKESRVEVNYPGIDLAHFQNLVCDSSLRYDAVSLSRLHPSKGIFELVEIWKLVCQERPGAKLAIIGGGSEKIKYDLEAYVGKLGLQKTVDILGYLDDSRAHQILKSGRIFVLASREEGFGMVILEAMACGLPAVAWDLPVFREVFPEGMLRIPMGDKEKFAKAALSLLDGASLYEKVSRETGDISKKYDWDKIAARELNLMSSFFQRKEIFA